MAAKLFLDDVRIPHDCAKYMRPKDLMYLYEDNDWDIVRTYEDFMGYIEHFGLPQLISFDHDLADEHYKSDMFDSNERYNKLYDGFKEKTGYDCAKWLVDYCIKKNEDLPFYIVHSMNPVGRENILSLLDNYKNSKG